MPAFGIPAPFLAIMVATVATVPIVLRTHVVEAREAATQHRFAFDLLRSRPLVAGLMLGAALFMMIGTFDALWAIVLDDLGSADWIANVGITFFALPLIFLGSFGGRLAIGLNADGDAIPDLPQLAEGVRRSLVELTEDVGAS